MSGRLIVATAVFFFAIPGPRASAEEKAIPFDAGQWKITEGKTVEHLGRQALCGSAYLDGIDFADGIISVDVAVSGARSYPGIIFRRQSDAEYERLYIRPHRAGLYPDAVHYAPTFNGVTCWQLYHGDGFCAAATFPHDEWFTLRLEIKGRQMRVFIGDAREPVLIVNALKLDATHGEIGVMGPADGTAFFSNFRVELTDDLAFDAPPQEKTPDGTLQDWQLSKVYPANQVDITKYPYFFTIFNAGWETVVAEPNGLVNISKHREQLSGKPSVTLARTIVQCDEPRRVQLSFGYSDIATIFLNGRPVFTGVSGYQSRDPSFLGMVGLHDMVYLPLEKGRNEVCLMSAETFGGWGFMCHAEPALQPPVRNHDLIQKVWETPADFRVPESVLYDSKRDILFVTSFDRVDASHKNMGFISKLTLDGKIAELEWIKGLDGPCGMAIRDDVMYVLEGFAKNVLEIDIPSGKVLKRTNIPEARFLNDLAVDASGNVYISDTTIEPGENDIYKYKNGRYKVWKTGHDLQRANVVYLHKGKLLVGSTGDGLFKSVSLKTREVKKIACLGAGVIDGIRPDGEGCYLVSQWEGMLYRISLDGDVVELMDTMADRLNLADFEYVADQRLLIAPTFLGNKVVAYRLKTG